MSENKPEIEKMDAGQVKDYAGSLIGVDEVTPRVNNPPPFVTAPWTIFSLNEFHFDNPLEYVALNEWNRWATDDGNYLYSVRTCGWFDADNPGRILGTSCFTQADDMVRQGAVKVSEEWADNFVDTRGEYSFMLQEVDADWSNPRPPKNNYPFHEFVLLSEFVLTDCDQEGKIDEEIKAATEGGRLGRRTVKGHAVSPWEAATWTARGDDNAIRGVPNSYRGQPNTRNYYTWFSKRRDADDQNAVEFMKELKARYSSIIHELHITRMVTWLDWGRGTFDHDSLPPLPQPNKHQ